MSFYPSGYLLRHKWRPSRQKQHRDHHAPAQRISGRVRQLSTVGERFIVDLEAGKPTCQLGKTLMVAATLKLGLEADPRAFEARQSTPEIPEFSQGVAISTSGRERGE